MSAWVYLPDAAAYAALDGLDEGTLTDRDRAVVRRRRAVAMEECALVRRAQALNTPRRQRGVRRYPPSGPLCGVLAALARPARALPALRPLPADGVRRVLGGGEYALLFCPACDERREVRRRRLEARHAATALAICRDWEALQRRRPCPTLAILRGIARQVSEAEGALEGAQEALARAAARCDEGRRAREQARRAG